MSKMPKKARPHEEVKKMIRPKLTDQDLGDISEDEAFERAYYQDSVIIKVNSNDKLIDDIATCFSIEETMEYLMLAPLDFISRTDGIENEKEYKERLWKQVRNFYRAAQEILNKRYRL
jgi:hypothetical protein